jgi:threonine aldolase
MLGGGMRQAGVLAAAGIIALEQHVRRLAEDHANAQRLADGLAGIDELHVDPSAVQTNMVFIRLRNVDATSFSRALSQQNVVIPETSPMRLVTHLDISSDDVTRVLGAARQFFASGASRMSVA